MLVFDVHSVGFRQGQPEVPVLRERRVVVNQSIKKE